MYSEKITENCDSNDKNCYESLIQVQRGFLTKNIEKVDNRKFSAT